MLQSLPENWQMSADHKLLMNLALSATRPNTRIYKYREFQVTAFLHVVCGRFFFDEVFFLRDINQF